MKLTILLSIILIPQLAISTEYIAKKSPHISKIENTILKYNINVIKYFGPNNNFVLLKTKRKLTKRILQKITKSEDIEYIVTNDLVSIPRFIPSTPVTSNDWWHGHLQSEQAWQITRGNQNLIVAVIDTGVDYLHPDLASNIAINEDEIPNNHIDDDNNGKIDDYYGYNFFSNHSDPNDDNGHGTHCAGIIAANGKITGAAPNIKILPLKFLNQYGAGDIAKSIMAIHYAIERGAKIISNSYGTPNPNKALKEMIQYAEDAGVLFVAAAGNAHNNNDIRGEYPANFDLKNIISVAANGENRAQASFTNYGSYSVDIFAPGVSILSTDKNGTYKTRSGTSMSTPFVAGAAALMWSLDSNLSVYEIKENIMRSSVKQRQYYSKAYSAGTLNLYTLLAGIFTDLDYPVSRDQVQTRRADIFSDNPYANNTSKIYQVHSQNSRYIQLNFEYLDTEVAFDSLQIENDAGKVLDKVSGHFKNFKTIFYPYSTLNIRILSDHSGRDKGFHISEINYVD